MIAKILVQVEVRENVPPDQYATAVRAVLEREFPAENWFVVVDEQRPPTFRLDVVTHRRDGR